MLNSVVYFVKVIIIHQIDCTKVTDPKIRKHCIFQKNLCLSPKHKAANCKSNYLCKKCNRRHNIAICQKDLHKTPLGSNQQQTIVPNTPLGSNQQQPIVPNTPVTNSADPSLFQKEQIPVAGQQVNTASNYSGNSSNNILLQTTEANILNLNQKNTAKSSFLFDSGAQRTYITKELKQKLNLIPFKQDKIAIKVFGSTESKYRRCKIHCDRCKKKCLC